MAYSVYHNPRSVRIGTTAIAGVERIAVNRSFEEVRAAGDGEVHQSVARYSLGRTGGSITLADPAAAAAVAGLTGTLSFVWTGAAGGADKTVTVPGCSLGGWSAEVAEQAASEATVPFIAEGPPVVS